MTMIFTGSYDELKTRLAFLEGEWDHSKEDRKIFRLDGGLMNWHQDSGRISFQGKESGKSKLEEHVPFLLETKLHSQVLNQRIAKLIAAVCKGMFEREEIIAVALLGALCGQNTFLYGPPGTAKSLISRRIACAFSQPIYFEYLMNRFSTPEDVFGPVSIKALKEDQYTRKTDCYLPKAEFAFLDEIWKSSPAILNTLLTLINERIFRNGESIENAPLKALIAASNETPEANQGLEALYDRFIVRLMVGPIEQSENFDKLLRNKPTDAAIEVENYLLVKPEEWLEWREKLCAIELSSETLTIVHLIRESLSKRFEELNVYVSDRRWQRAAMLMKAAAFFNGRSQTNHSDALLLRHCLWTKDENRIEVNLIVDQAVKDSGFDTGISLADIDAKKEILDKEIHQELFHSTDIYDVVIMGDKSFFKSNINFYEFYSRPKKITIYIPYDKLKSKNKFSPVDINGNEIQAINCKFDGQGSCLISQENSQDVYDFKPTILFNKGDKKPEVNTRLVDSLAQSVVEIKDQLRSILNTVETQRQDYEIQLASLFVPKERTALAIDGIIEQIESLNLRIKDCERLEALCK
jgi:MoxR-like ATPase